MINNIKSKNPNLKNICLRFNIIKPINYNFILTNTLIFLISIFYFWNINGGHDWGGDFSMYIMNAENILQRTPYDQTGYIYNNEVVYGPSAYPPIFPLLLTPFISIWGINLRILKIPGILCFIVFLIFFNQLKILRNICFPLRILMIFLIGLFPYFFILSESIMSDFAFLLFSFVSLDLMNKTIKFENFSPKELYFYFLSSFFIALAYGTRTIGIVLFPVYLILSTIKLRKKHLGIILSILFSILLILVQNSLVSQTGDYLDFVPRSLSGFASTLLNSFIYYFSLFFGLIPFENFLLQSVVFIILIELFVVGFISRTRKGVSSFEIFFVLYIGILLIWPSYQFLRFLVPVIPLYFLYIFLGLEKITCLIKNPFIKIAIPVLLISLLSFSFFNSYSSIFPRPLSDIEKVETQELFQYVKSNTTQNDVILFFKPRVLALFTERKSVAMAFPAPNGDEFSRMREFGVTIAILRKGHYMEYQPELEIFINEHPYNFNLLFNNSEFSVYKIVYD